MTKLKNPHLFYIFLISVVLIAYPTYSIFTRNESFKIEDCYKKVKNNNEEKIYHCVTEFSDSFEDDLVFKEEGWHRFQLESSNGSKGDPLSRVEKNQETVKSGPYSLKTSTPASPNLQKASIGRELLFFPPKSNVWFSGWFFVSGQQQDVENLFIFDIESTRTYKFRGRRLVLTGSPGHLLFNSKWAGRNFYQKGNPTIFPRNKWVKLNVHLYLSAEDDGLTEVWQDDKLIINETGQNIPKNNFYDWIEVGITANSTHEPQTVFVDDIIISNHPI